MKRVGEIREVGFLEMFLFDPRHVFMFFFFHRHYVSQLSDAEKSRIAIYMNHDMLASPNYIINVKNATNAPFVTQAGIVVQGMYEDYYNERNIAFLNGALQGGSDFLSFLEDEIPAHGLSAGAGEVKDSEGRDEYGGLADGASFLFCFLFVFVLFLFCFVFVFFC